MATTDDEKIAQALNLLANSPDTMGLGAANALNDNRPDSVIKGEDGQLHNTNATLDANGNWSINPDEEAVYYFTQPLEDDRYNNYGEASEDYSHNYGQGFYRTEEEIKEFWDGDKGTGMELFKEQNPNLSFDDYLSFVKDSNEAYVDNPNATYADNQQNVDALANEYGLATTYTDSDGQQWGFNGSGLNQTKFVDTSFDYGALIMGAAASALTAGLVGPALSGYGMLGNAGAAGISSAAGQLASTGSIDPLATLSGAVVGGLNPGGMLAENFGQATKIGTNIVPSNVVGGFVQGATNDLVSNAITQGELDLQSALVGGLMGAGTKAATDFLEDASQFSVEAQMEKIKTTRALNPTLTPPLSDTELYAAALNLTQTGTSNLAGLIGQDGLLPFIDPVSTTGLNTLLGGGEFLPNAVFTDSQGNQYTDTQLLSKGISPADVYAGAEPGFTSGIKTQQNTILGDAFDAIKNVPGVAQTLSVGGGILDAMGNQQFKSTYGATPEEFLASGTTMEELKQIVAYGPLDELYNFSDNPRGTSQMVGVLSGIPGTYSTGANNLISTYLDLDNSLYNGKGYIQDALPITNAQNDVAANANAGSGSAAIINLGGTETVVSANTILPGINTTISDAIIGGFINGVLVDSDANSATVSTDGNTTTNTLDTTATTIDQSTIDQSTIDQNTIDQSTIDQNTIDQNTIDPNTVLPPVVETVVDPNTVLPPVVTPPVVETVVDPNTVLPPVVTPPVVETVVDPNTVLPPPETVVPPTIVLPETVVPPTIVLPPSSGGGGGGGGGFNFRGGSNMFEPQNIGMPGFGDPALLAAMQFPIVNYLEQYRSARQPKVNSMDGLFKDYLA